MTSVLLALYIFGLATPAIAEDGWSETWEVNYSKNEPGVTPLTEKELEVCPINSTGFIYNSYSVFKYYKNDNPDGILRFSDTVHYFNTLNDDVTFTFQVTQFHESRPHTVPLPDVISKDYIFYPLPKEVSYIELPDSLTVPAMHKGELELRIEIDEDTAYEYANNGGLITMVSGTPSVHHQLNSGVKVTSVPAYKIFFVLMSDENIIESQGESNDDGGTNWLIFAILGIAVVCVIIYMIVRNIEYIEVDEDE